MNVRQYQAVLSSMWVLTICAAAIVTGVASPWALAFVAVVALLPPVAMQLLWRDPPETMSESIRQARR